MKRSCWAESQHSVHLHLKKGFCQIELKNWRIFLTFDIFWNSVVKMFIPLSSLQLIWNFSRQSSSFLLKNQKMSSLELVLAKAQVNVCGILIFFDKNKLLFKSLLLKWSENVPNSVNENGKMKESLEHLIDWLIKKIAK